MQRVFSFVLVFVSVAAVAPSLNGASVVSALDPQGAAVLPADAALIENALRVSDRVPENPTILNQCSRPSLAYNRIVHIPRATTPPTHAEILALETTLNALLADRLEAFRESYPEEASGTPQVRDYYRQYSAFQIGDWRVIYVSGFPSSDVNLFATGGPDWRQEPIVICDGGECCFGVEYYPAINAFANFSFNGTFSGRIRLRR